MGEVRGKDMKRGLLQTIRSAFTQTWAALRWLFESEQLESVALDNPCTSNSDSPSFFRWVFARSTLEQDEPIAPSARAPSILFWLLAGERLEREASRAEGSQSDPVPRE